MSFDLSGRIAVAIKRICLLHQSDRSGRTLRIHFQSRRCGGRQSRSGRGFHP
jgi:hypothetical protein